MAPHSHNRRGVAKSSVTVVTSRFLRPPPGVSLQGFGTDGGLLMAYDVKVNGETRSVDVDGDTPLLWVIRDELKLTGSKYGCGVAQCGACTVHIDGQPLRSCSIPIDRVGGRAITTIEAADGPEAKAVRAAWIAHDVPQCGYCQSGQIMSAIALLREVRRPSDHDIDLAMNGNICRCATYVRIRAAIHTAAKTLEA
jgi:isoquinoline 1-oxidoreductase alpha subunit